MVRDVMKGVYVFLKILPIKICGITRDSGDFAEAAGFSKMCLRIFENPTFWNVRSSQELDVGKLNPFVDMKDMLDIRVHFTRWKEK